jgi:trans-aconitate methyltransferase
MKNYYFYILLIVLFLSNIKSLIAHQTWDGEKYHQYSGQQYDTALRVLSYAQFNGNESVLDLGCGSGKVTADLGTYYFTKGSATGIDIVRV